MLLWLLFWAFIQVGLFSVGGGYAAIPLGVKSCGKMGSIVV